jgi:dTDP-4-dehydrorhamnose 3,5-epimerase-like enzyme
MSRLFSVNDCNVLPLPDLADGRNIIDLLVTSNIPFDVKRLYYIKNVPLDTERGGHAHKDLFQLIFSFNGEYELELYDAKTRKIVTMNDSRRPILIGPGIWRELRNFSPTAICLVLASEPYSENDYIRDIHEFEKWRESGN